MKYHEEDPIAEIHRIRAELLEEYGGLEGYYRHQDEELPRLIKEGWHIALPETIAKLKQKHQVTKECLAP